MRAWCINPSPDVLAVEEALMHSPQALGDESDGKADLVSFISMLGGYCLL